MGKIADLVGNAIPIAVPVPVATGITEDSSFSVFRAPEPGHIIAAGYTADVALSGANTNSRDLQFVNKHADASGAHDMGTIHLTSGINLVAFVYKAVVTTAYKLATGDVVEFYSLHVGNGLTRPKGTVMLYWQPTNI